MGTITKGSILDKPLKPKPTKIMTLRLHMTIADHDLQRKLTQAEKALGKGEQVRIQLQLKGREKGRTKQASEWLTSKVTEPLGTISVLNKPVSPANLNIVLFPKKKH